MEVDMEKFMFIAFRSREHTVKFFEEMRSRGIVGTVINTPREAEAGCGLSVRFSPRQKNAVLSILERHGYSSFIGVLRQPPLTEKGLSVLRNQSSRRSS